MDDALRAYEAGRADGMAARRDKAKGAYPANGADYRIGFLDGRLEVYRMHAELRQIAEES